MICDNCGQEGAYIRKTTKAYGSGDSLVVIEDVPMISCRNCGVDLMTAETLHRIDDLKTYLRSQATSKDNVRPVKVACFQAEVPPSSQIEPGQMTLSVS
ncbi:MAG: YgiT-type zinc finger domain-containing protein [Candidatus Chloroheliales bacterium]|nr:MAG: YgiT-type zinc finger domain-containing protein [Chloroflexota bacterium]